MDVKEAIATLEKSSEFLDWKKTHEHCYLVHCFLMLDIGTELDEAEWQIGYYDKDIDKVTTFVIGKKITKNPESEAFKEEHKTINELKKQDIQQRADKILYKLQEFIEEKYPNQPIAKRILLLQNLDEYGPVWNITIVTSSFNTLSVKIDPKTADIIEHHLSSLFDLRKQG